MRHYEVAVVMHPDLEIDLDRAASKVETMITGLGGKIDKKDNWGKRKLAYRIKKQDWGIYAFYQVTMDPSLVQPLNNTLRITDEVMRYLIVATDDIKVIMKPKSDPKKRPSRSEGIANTQDTVEAATDK